MVETAMNNKEERAVLWEQLDETNIEVEEFDAMFSRPVAKPKAKKTDKKEDEEAKKKKVGVAKLLDKGRSQDVGICIKSNHLDIGDVENTIYNFDNSLISFDILGQIQRIQATAEEVAMFRAQVESCPDIPLDQPEQFLLDLSQISHFDFRLKCFMFQSTFRDNLADIEDRLNNVSHVCDQLLNSTSMKQVFSVILTCGNYMNGGNKQRGQADGFGIDILPKLKDVKSKDNSITLLQYIVRFCILNYDDQKGSMEAKLPVPEPSDVDRSANINFDEQKAEGDKLKNQLAQIERARDKVIAESDPEHLEPFQEKMNAFLEKASVELKELQDSIEGCYKKFVRTMAYYQFKAKTGKQEDLQPKDFFFYWHPFCEDYKNYWKREQILIEKEIEKEQRMKHKKASERMKSFSIKPIKAKGLKEKILKRKDKNK